MSGNNEKKLISFPINLIKTLTSMLGFEAGFCSVSKLSTTSFEELEMSIRFKLLSLLCPKRDLLAEELSMTSLETNSEKSSPSEVSRGVWYKL